MTLTNQRAGWSLQATAARTAIGTTGSAVIGVQNGAAAFTDANIAHSFKVTAAAVGNIATLTFSSGAVAQTTGSPSVTRRGAETNNLAGTDFEGAALPTLATLYGVMLSGSSGNSDLIEVNTSDGLIVDAFLYPGGNVFWHDLTGLAITTETIQFTFGSIGDIITVTVIGKTA